MAAVDVRELPPLSLATICRARVALRAVEEKEIEQAIVEEDQVREMRAAARGSRRAGLGTTPRCGGCHRFMAHGTSLHNCGFDQHRGWQG